MSVSLAGFRARFPEFSNVVSYPDSVVDLVLLEAIRQVNPDHFEARADDATYYLAAHILAVTGSARGSGLLSVQAGQASIQYAQSVAADADDLTSTLYGKMYRRLVKLGGPGARLVC